MADTLTQAIEAARRAFTETLERGDFARECAMTNAISAFLAAAPVTEGMLEAGVQAKSKKRAEVGPNVVIAGCPVGTIFDAMISQMRKEIEG